MFSTHRQPPRPTTARKTPVYYTHLRHTITKCKGLVRNYHLKYESAPIQRYAIVLMRSLYHSTFFPL